MHKHQTNITIGEKVNIKLADKKDYSGIYCSRVEDVGNEKITCAMPSQKGILIPLKIGETVKILMTKSDGIYSFASPVLDRGLEPLPIFSVCYPSSIERHQRRKYFRIPMSLDLELAVERTCQRTGRKLISEQQNGLILNLSGGGIYFISRKKLEINDRLRINFMLPNGLEFDKLACQVNREEILREKQQFRYSAEFTHISERIRERIIAYVFEYQRTTKLVA